MPRSPYAAGVAAAVLSNILFAVLYLYSSWMQPMHGTAVFAWRIVAMWAVFLCFVLLRHNSAVFQTVAAVLRHRYKRWLYLLGTAVFASQLWLFMWAPVNGHGLDVAVGYFLFPLVMVFIGRVFFREKMSGLQVLAVVCAVAGVAHEIWAQRTFSWVTAWVAGTYPLYFIGRRQMKISVIGGLMADLSLIVPFTAVYLLSLPQLGIPEFSARYFLLIPTLGLISAAAMQSNLFAGFTLPVALFGMFSYLEPTLLFLLAVFVLHTPPAPGVWITYAFIGAGIVLVLADNYRKLKKV